MHGTKWVHWLVDKNTCSRLCERTDICVEICGIAACQCGYNYRELANSGSLFTRKHNLYLGIELVFTKSANAWERTINYTNYDRHCKKKFSETLQALGPYMKCEIKTIPKRLTSIRAVYEVCDQNNS